MNKTKSKHPLLTLGEKDKFYLALSQEDDGKFAYIYALLLKQDRAGRFVAIPKCEVMTFDDKSKATLYFNTLEKLMLYQHNKKPDLVASFNGVVEKFYEHTK